MLPTLTPQEFLARWGNVASTEQASAQSHFIDLCHLLGESAPFEENPSQEFYAFEKAVTKTSASPHDKRGRADVWKRGYFAWEYKRPGGDLSKAYDQLLQYREALENPPLLVVSDIRTIEVHTNITNTVKQVRTWTIEDLLNPARRDELRRIWTDPTAFRSHLTPAMVTERAAKEFAKLADLLRKWGEPADRAARFLIRILFCLFAEDAGLLPNSLLTRLLNKTWMRPKEFTAQLGQVFSAMRTGGFFALEDIPRFNGGLFDDDDVVELDGEGLVILSKICTLDWGHIEPGILGTLFERSLDPSKRAQLGAHYTSKHDIERIIEPVLVAPLRRRWEDVQQYAHALVQRRSTSPVSNRPAFDRELQALLLGFIHELANIRVLDPACGSGNFLYVALKQLLDLEKEVIVFMGTMGLTGPFPTVSPEQLHGIEINEYAHELAQATVWIGYIQWLRDNGFGVPAEPILKPLHTIRQMDAILQFDAVGRPVEPTWPKVDVIIGNPPFLGGNRIRKELGDHYVNALFRLYEGRVPAFADLVCYWFERARQHVAADDARRAGLLATNSIRDGASRRVLDRIKETCDIFMAWSDRPWVLEGAAVRVSMVGFDNGSEKTHTLNGALVENIHADLTSSLDLTAALRLKENASMCFMGPSAKGPFEIDAGTARRMLHAPLNVNGRSNGDVVRPVANAADLVQRSRRMWTIDFGLMPLEEAAEYELPFAYLKQHVYPVRSRNRRAAYAERWWQYAEARPGMRAALVWKRRYIATPAVAKHRIFVWVDSSVLCNQRNLVFAYDDDYFMGVLHSKTHELWALATGSTLEDRPCYTPTTTFETFPFPWPPGCEPKGDTRVAAIAQSARELVEKRDRWLNPEGATEAELKKRTLTNLYNERPTWLNLAHRKLDQAVLDAYGWPHDLSDEEILSRLLALNLERAAAQGAEVTTAMPEEEIGE